MRGDGDEAISLRPITLDPGLFVRAAQFPEHAEEIEIKPFRRWQAYSQELRRDPSLLAYYDFQQRKGEPAVLPNVAANSGRSLDGAVTNATWTTGRMVGKHALLFQNTDNFVRIDLPQKTADLTLAVWVCIDALGEGHTISGLLMSEGYDLHWQIANWAGHLSLSSTMTGQARSWEVIGPQQFRHWMHLASTYDHAKARVRFYTNGSATGEADCRPSEPMAIGPAWIGNWKQEVRSLHGKIDELAIWGRPLTAEEVRRMFEAGKAETSSWQSVATPANEEAIRTKRQ